MLRADNGNETFTNPVIFADYPDPDIIRRGEDYYLISSAFHKVPGMPILHSVDLVNWEPIGYVYDYMELTEKYNLTETTDVYRGGPWAPSLRYNPKNGKYYVSCTSNDEAEGFMVFVADQITGPYHLHLLGSWLFDPGMLITEEGRIYVFYGRDEIMMVELAEDCSRFVTEPRLVYKNEYKDVLEGTHAYYKDGYYYLSSTICGRDAKQVIARAKAPEGPYEAKVVCDGGTWLSGAYSHQGGLIDTPEGDWWFFMFQDWDYVGRCPIIQPLTWIEGWPIPGDPLDAFKQVVTWKKPVQGKKPFFLGTERSDEFDCDKLGLQWQWNHNPVEARFSLSERKGYLRLKAAYASGIRRASNTLVQRIAGLSCTGTIALETEGMQEGDVAGLWMTNFAKPSSYIAIEKTKDTFDIVMLQDQQEIARVENLSLNRIYLRCIVSRHGSATMWYSLDNDNFVPLGNDLKMTFTIDTFMGYHFGIFNFNHYGQGGYTDIDWFQLETPGAANHFNAYDEIDACRYDRSYDIETRRCTKYHFGESVTPKDRGAYLCFDHIDFNEGISRIEINAACGGESGIISVTLDDILGEEISNIQITNTGGSQNYQNFEASAKKVTGIHRVYVRFLQLKGERKALNMDWFRFY